MATAKKATAVKKTAAPKITKTEFYWAWGDTLNEAVDTDPNPSLQDALKEATEAHLDNSDENSVVHIWKVEKVAVKKLKTIVQITD